MGIAYNPKIVTDGLVLCLDAGNTKSYPGSGTTWTDLSGQGNTGTLTNGPTFSSSNGGSIVFDGTNDYVQGTGSIVTSAATFIVWMLRNGNQPNYAGILFSRGTSTSGMGFFGTSNKISYHWNDDGNTFSWDSGLTTPTTWCMCAVSVGAASATAYLCQTSGITSATNSVSHTSSTLDDIKVGVDEAVGDRWFKGNISQALLYNRALTAAEVQQNFNALRGRYGI